MSETFRILVLCTGNICRSPAGELLLQHLLGESVEVRSAGTHALTGHPVEPQMAALLPPNIGVEQFAARQLTPEMLREADLVLGMAREHRARAAELMPAVVRQTYTLREFARILEYRPDAFERAGTPAEFLRAAMPITGKLRSLARAQNPADDDIDDPYKRDDDAFAAAYASIHDAARTITSATSDTPV